jgi:hypothetical protein
MRKATISFVASSRPQAAELLQLKGFSRSCILGSFTKMYRETEVRLKYEKITDTVHEELPVFMTSLQDKAQKYFYNSGRSCCLSGTN